jgi:hypothetical protein
MIATIYARIDGTLAHVWDADYGTPEVGSIPVMQFDIETYPDEFAFISANSASAFWNNISGALEIPQGNVYLDATWIADAQSELDTQGSVTGAKQTILANAERAWQFAPSIAALFAESTEQAEAMTSNLDTLITTYRIVVEAQGTGFRNAFQARLTAFGITDVNNMTNQQKIIYALYFDLFSALWTLTLTLQSP